MKKKDINGFVESMIDRNSQNLEIRKSIWNKEIDIMIPHNHRVKRISKEQEFIIKLIFYLEYISSNNLKAILSPIMNANQVDYIVGELIETKLLICIKRGYYGSFYCLSKFCLEQITGVKNEGEYVLKNISDCTLESQDYKHIYLAEMVIKKVLDRLNKNFNNMSVEAKEGYINSLFIKNISFDLMMERPDRTAYLKSIGYNDKTIKMVNDLKGYYSERERNRYKDKVLSAGAETLGYDKYYKSYKKMFYETKDTFEKYNLLHDLIETDYTFDYFECIKQVIYPEIIVPIVKDGVTQNMDKGRKHNLLRYQTSDVRQGIYTLAQLVARDNGIKGKLPDVIKNDKEISDYLDRISSLNAICMNLRRNLKKGEITEAEAPYYSELMKYIKQYENLKAETQKTYNERKKVVTFYDSKSAINEEDRPIITLRALELRNVFIGNIEKKIAKNGVSYLDITVVNIDSTKDLKNFKSSGLRRDYFGICEKLKSIKDDIDITVNINYIYCYPEGSNIVGYENRLKRIFDNSSTSNANMQGADKFIIKELKPYTPKNVYMEKINKMIIF